MGLAGSSISNQEKSWSIEESRCFPVSKLLDGSEHLEDLPQIMPFRAKVARLIIAESSLCFPCAVTLLFLFLFAGEFVKAVQEYPRRVTRL